MNDPEDIAVLLTDSGLLNKMVFNFAVFFFFKAKTVTLPTTGKGLGERN